MRVVIDIDETLTVGAHIEGVTQPTQNQCEALRELAITAGNYRSYLVTEPVWVDHDDGHAGGYPHWCGK